MLKPLRFLGWPVATGVLAALLIMERYPSWVGLPETFSLLPVPTVASYADAMEQAMPAVANLYTLKRAAPTSANGFSLGLNRQQRMESSLGSAVIMTPEGHLLTNNHVIANAEQIIVALHDGRETQAQVVGRDPETDLAVLKIALPSLPTIQLGQSEAIRIGDIALAIGNPFGVGQTATLGIVSATGRNHLGLNTYEDFIQTDAAINRGNSGGALVDARGRLIGINAAILSDSGGSQGIGFAIPSAQALEVMQAIIKHGQVIRGWLGVEVQLLPAQLVSQLAKRRLHGILVAGVDEKGPAAQAGLRAGDILLAVDGLSAADGRATMNQVARAQPGSTLQLTILRGDTQQTLNAQVGVRPRAVTP